MSSFGSSLDDDAGIAEELAAEQRAISIAEFFEKNKHMLGFDSGARALVTAVKEAVDNSLDATEEAGILPDIYVKIEEVDDYYRIIVEDNGPGITKEEIPKVFGKLLYGSRFHKREQSLTPDQQLLIARDGEIETVPIGMFCDAWLPPTGERDISIPPSIEAPVFDRDSHELSWEPITHVFRHKTEEPTYEITTDAGRRVKVTGNHSLFSLNPDGSTREIEAGELTPDDTILAPRQLPQYQTPIDDIHLLEVLPEPILENATVTVSDLHTVSPGAGGDDTLPDEIPALEATHLDLHEHLTDGTLCVAFEDRQLRAPVTVELTPKAMRALGERLFETHSGPTQLHDDRSDAIRDGQGVSTTSSVVRAMDMIVTAHDTLPDEDLGIPSFVFRASPSLQRDFLDACWSIDDPDNTDSWEPLQTNSERLARQLSLLWSMHGVLVTTNRRVADPEDDPENMVSVSVNPTSFTTSADVVSTDEPRPELIPTSILEEVSLGSVSVDYVPDSMPGLLFGAGVSDSMVSARKDASLLEHAMACDPLTRDMERLEARGLVTPNGTPTEHGRDLWETLTELEGITKTDLCLLRVVDVTTTPKPEYVYDVSVPGATGVDENFVVANEGPICVRNSRGQQGIGISAAVLYAQLTSGKPVKVTSRTGGAHQAEYFEVVINTDDNEPEIRDEGTTTWDRPHGTRLELEMEANLRARKQLHQYIKQTAVVNPHARVELQEPDETLKFERVTDELPAKTSEIRPHPHGVELGSVLKMLRATDSHSLSGFLQTEFTRVGRKTADSILDGFRDRHFGRELSWEPPATHEKTSVETAVIDATANKGAKATKRFGTEVEAAVTGSDRISYSALESIVADAADTVETEFGTTFGVTVQSNAVEAAWTVITADKEADLFRILDSATSSHKDADVIEGLATRIAEKFDGEENQRHRLTRGELTSLVDRTADMTAEMHDVSIGKTARENIVTALWECMDTVPDELPSVRSIEDDRDAANELVDAMREASIMAPPTDCLSPITSELIEAGLEKEYDADFITASTRDGKVHAGDPFIVEAGIAYGGSLEEDAGIDVLRFANRVPLVYQRGACAIADVVSNIGWRNYGLTQPGGSGIPVGPVVVMVHVASTNVPFTSESKDAVANVPIIEDEIELVIRECARELKSYLNKRESLQQRREKAEVLTTILPQMAKKVASVTGRSPPNIEDALARIMNNVLVNRSVNNGEVTLRVRNHSDSDETFEITEILDVEPADLPDSIEVVQMDGEWYLMWSVTVASREEATLSYQAADGGTSQITIDGIDNELVTVTQSS